MPNETRVRRSWLLRTLGIGLLCVGVLVLGAGVANAKKPIKPPPPPPAPVDLGTIYYANGNALHQMNADGSDDTTLHASIAHWAEPSMHIHGGRWFLQVQAVDGAYYPAPDGVTPTPQYELHAVHESGFPSMRLTDGCIDATHYVEPNQELNGLVSDTSCVVRWTADDAIVSYTAVITTYDDEGNRTVLDGGIYALNIDPDALATHAATAMSGYPLLSLDMDPTETRVLAQSYDWEPNGLAIVYPNHHASTGLGVWIAWEDDGFTTPTYLMANGTQLRWSPDGTRILYNYDGIRSIGVGGEGEHLLIEDPEDTRQETRSVSWPTWSPDGTYIAYMVKTVALRKFKVTYGVFRATETGGDTAEISPDGGSLPRWRN